MTRLPTAAATGLASILPDMPAGSLALAAAVAASAQAAPALAQVKDRPTTALAALAARWADLMRQRADPDENNERAVARLAAMDEVTSAAARLPARTDAERAIKARMLAQVSVDTTGDDQLLSSDDAGIAIWARRKVEEGSDAEQLTGSLVLDLLGQDAQPSAVTSAHDALPLAQAADHAAQPDAALLDLGRRWTALSMGWQRLDADAPRSETREECDARLTTLVHAEGEIVTAIMAVPATTPAGLAVKARVLIREASEEDFPADEAAVLVRAGGFARDGRGQNRGIGSLCLDLLRLAQEQQQ